MGAIWPAQCSQGDEGGDRSRGGTPWASRLPGPLGGIEQRTHTAILWKSSETQDPVRTRSSWGAATLLLPYDVATNSPESPPRSRSLLPSKHCIIRQWSVPKDNPPRPISVNADGVVRPQASLIPPPSLLGFWSYCSLARLRGTALPTQHGYGSIHGAVYFPLQLPVLVLYPPLHIRPLPRRAQHGSPTRAKSAHVAHPSSTSNLNPRLNFC